MLRVAGGSWQLGNKKMKKLIRQRFGRLVVICLTNKRQWAHVIWLCRCDCGNLTEVSSNSLLMGLTRSCGCLRKERVGQAHTIHGDTANGKRLRVYKTWEDMKGRCLNPNDSGYKYYGGRGITVCDNWNSYQNFRDWAFVNGYTDDLTIDRIDSDGNYEPNNCQWITKAENNRKDFRERDKNGRFIRGMGEKT